MTINNYPIIYRPQHPRHNRDGYIYQHIEVAELKLGRFLKPEEVVHHRDKNRMNNDPNNLLIFISKSDHTSFHRHNCDESLLTFLDDGTCTINYLKTDVCPLCHNIKDKHAKICLKCAKQRGPVNKNISENDLTRDKLKQLIREKSFTQIGKLYGVTDNAIRKWCDKYQLPRTKKEINNYSDQEWNFI